MTIKNELRAFYANQGLTGKHLRKALRHDMKAVKRSAIKQRGRLDHRSLVHAFGWDWSPEGVDYWGLRSLALNRSSRKSVSVTRQFN